jgi:hypothetical protein
MKSRGQSKFVHEGKFVAEVKVRLIDSGEAWGPYLSLEDARRLDEVRLALRRGDIVSASRMARVFRLMPVTAA